MILPRLILSFILISGIATAQTTNKADSLVDEICKTIGETRHQPDTTRIIIAFQKHLFPFLQKYPADQRKEIGTNVYFRLQRNCKDFADILLRERGTKGDWKAVDRKPTTIVNKETCGKFLDHKTYKYLESNGDTVNIKIENGYWIDSFKDGTYSKLKLHWMTDCEFVIEFIESNNRIRKNFSKPGDKYQYQIVDKKDGYYDMSVEIFGTERYMTFKIYY